MAHLLSNVAHELASLRAAVFLSKPLAKNGIDASFGDLLLVIGGVWLAGFLVSAAVRYLGSLLASATKRSLRSYGQWAVVTGASDGIGKAYARAVAKAGLNVILIARDAVKLEAVATELRSATGREVRVVVADFSQATETGLYDRIKSALGDLDIGVLINNVGASYPGALYFHELPDQGVSASALVRINVDSMLGVTAAVLPGMLQRRRGAILNISSAAGRVPIGNPLYAVYSGCKAFVDYFSRSIAEEYRGRGIVIAAHTPYFVATKMARIRHATLFAPSPASWVAASLGALGSSDVSSVVPYWPHALQDAALQALPTTVLRSYLMSLHKGLRARFLAKAKASPAEVAEPAPKSSSSTRAGSKKAQ